MERGAKEWIQIGVFLLVMVAGILAVAVPFGRHIKEAKERDAKIEQKERVESKKEHGLMCCRDAIMYLNGAGEETDSFHRSELLEDAWCQLADARMYFNWANEYYDTNTMYVSMLDDLVNHLIAEGKMYSNMYVESWGKELDTKRVKRKSYANEISRIREVMKAYHKK